MGSKCPPRARSRTQSKPSGLAIGLDLPANVVPLRLRIMPRHAELLARWLEAGRPMGLSDASTFVPARKRTAVTEHDYVVVWVRENIDPAYTIVPDGTEWNVMDAVRHRSLGRFRSFAAALHFIRPVLPLEAAA